MSSVPEHIVVILADAFRPDYLYLYDLPHLTQLCRTGTVVAECRSVFPATTTANLTSFITGTLPAGTGIPNNARYDRSLDKVIGPLRDNKALTLAEWYRNAGLETISVNYPMLVDRGVSRHLSGNMDTVIAALLEHKPFAVVYYTGQTDAVGHNHGPFSTEMRQTVTELDQEIGRLQATLVEHNLAHNTVIAFASDHGMSPNNDIPITPALQEAIQSAGLIVAKPPDAITPDSDVVWLQGGSAFLYWRNGKKTAARQAYLLAALGSIPHCKVLGSAEITALGTDPQMLGDIVVVPDEGYCIVKGSGNGGLHGRPQEAHNTLIFWGCGVKPGHIVDRASIVDAVPTLLSLAGIEPVNLDGKVLAVAEPTSISSRVSEGVPSPVSTNDMVPTADATTTKLAITADFGRALAIKSIEISATLWATSASSFAYTIESSSQEGDLQLVAEGYLQTGVTGDPHFVKFERPVVARVLHLTLHAPGEAGIELTGLRFWQDNEAVVE